MAVLWTSVYYSCDLTDAKLLVAEYAAGYQMYSKEMIDRVVKILKMKKDRMTLSEIQKKVEKF